MGTQKSYNLLNPLLDCFSQSCSIFNTLFFFSDSHKHKDKYREKEHKHKDHKKDKDRERAKHGNRYGVGFLALLRCMFLISAQSGQDILLDYCSIPCIEWFELNLTEINSYFLFLKL